jgi:hypothetical protein
MAMFFLSPWADRETETDSVDNFIRDNVLSHCSSDESNNLRATKRPKSNYRKRLQAQD